MPLGVIYATTNKGIFAVNGKLPWTCPSDMKYFRNLTLGTNIVMGRKTAESLTEALPGRKNFVISRYPFQKDGFIYTSIPEILDLSKTEKVWIIGGSNLINHFNECYNDQIDIISYTEIGDQYLTDESQTYLEDKSKILYHDMNMINYEDLDDIRLSTDVRLRIHARKGCSEPVIPRLDIDYLTIGRRILDRPIRVGRNGETRSIFDPDVMITSTFDYGFPILKTKQVWWKGIKEELQFFWDGKTETKELESKGVKIWSGNTSDKFLEDNGKSNLKPGQMGPMYGYQWRRFGVPYFGDDKHDGDHVGVDQLQNVIDLICRDPNSRRILMTTYNPAQSEEGVLYPCHSIVQHFYVDEFSRINMKTYQRSADWFLGVPFNISSSALFLAKIADEVNSKIGEKRYSPGNITTYFGDAHIYEVHVPVFCAQYVNSLVSQIPLTYVSLDIDNNLIGYHPERKFAAAMVV